MAKLTITDVELSNKKVLMRVDFNVPLDKQQNITDDTRIKETLPTIKYLLDKKCSLVLCAHLGRPKGKPVPEMSLKPCAAHLSKLAGVKVQMAPDCIGAETKKMADALTPGDILLLENLRFHPEEEKNDPNFAKELASMAEVFVQDAFGTVHRAHASTEGVTKYLPAYAGFLLKKEIDYLGKAVENPDKPFVAILGGAKISGKIDVISNLLNKVDTLIVGGAMTYTFLKAQGLSIGNSLVENDRLEMAKEVLAKAKEKKVTFLLPLDHLIADKVEAGARSEMVGENIPAGMIGVDIGPKTIALFIEAIKRAKTIVWNGPMGVFEIDDFAKGTIAIANALADATKAGATTIIGGGDSVAAVAKAGVTSKISHISTGGGASLEFLEGKILPGIAALKDK
ncbi:MAG: phosphoglycerate kinase [bacterium]|nr:phosphoglycerate kinase [bacterium]MDD5354169.1 phosphoglycerate kinase [bacterium]MDD5756983.1 phosphoglycerate kinase [bacterium]